MLQLHSHNKATYTNLTQIFETESRAAVIQPTGTGKSFIILKLIEDNQDKKFAVCSPSAYIFDQLMTHAEKFNVVMDNCEFFTYTKLSQMAENDLEKDNFNYIILDEFHRCGAKEWSKGVENLLSANEKAKVLGTSATPIRYLDSSRNMAEELFDGVCAVNMSLAEAIRKKILPLPVYVTSWYSFRGEVEKLEIKAEQSGNPRLKHVLLGKIQQAKRMLNDLDCGIEKIFEKHIPNRNGKYIIFCPNIEKLLQTKRECNSWFENVNRNIHKYSVFSGNPESEKEFESFKNDKDTSSLKLLFCVDMLNEGVHIDDVDGVIMLRATQSANVFYQQLGRALSCSEKTNNPVIFDIVNNYETGDTAKQYAGIMEISRENGEGSENGIEFELYDYVRDIKEILNELNETFENSWEFVFDILKEYKETYSKFPEYNEIYDGVLLGKWCSNQRRLFKNGKLSDEKISKLNEINFIWDLDEENWNFMFESLKNVVDKLGHFPKKSEFPKDDNRLLNWVNTQKILYRKNSLNAEKSEKLLKLGCKFNPSASEMWELRYSQLKDFVNKNGRFPTYGDSLNGKENSALYIWTNSQRKAKNSNKLSEEKTKKLDEISFPWSKRDANWDNCFEILSEFVKKYGRLPFTTESFGDFEVGKWAAIQRRLYESDKLDSYKKIRFESLGINLQPPVNEKFDRMWEDAYSMLKTMLEKQGMPKYSGDKEEVYLYKWIYKQRDDFRNGKLSTDKAERLRSIGVRVE